MKSSYFFILPVLLISCSGNKNSEAATNIIELKEDSVITDVQSPMETLTESERDLSTFPRRWVHITSTDSVDIIYNPCDAENLNITINKDFTELTVNYGQDGTSFRILGKKWREEPDITYIAYYLDIEIQNGKKKQTISVFYRPEPEYCTWTGIPNLESLENNFFIAESSAGLMMIVNQPCSDCRDDCDDE